jgi:hypothetical protein
MDPNSNQKRIAFGYNRNSKNEIVIHQGQAAVVKLIFDCYLEGCSMAEIKDNLENMGIPSPLNGKKWSKQTLANILSNPHYLGDELYPKIISEEQYNLAQTKKWEHIGRNGKTKRNSSLEDKA